MFLLVFWASAVSGRLEGSGKCVVCNDQRCYVIGLLKGVLDGDRLFKAFIPCTVSNSNPLLSSLREYDSIVIHCTFSNQRRYRMICIVLIYIKQFKFPE